MPRIRVRSVAAELLKGLAAYALWQVGMIVGQMAGSLLGLPVAQAPEGIDVGLVLLLSVPSGGLLAITLGKLFRQLRQPFGERFLMLFGFNYLIYGVLQVLEQLLFTQGTNLGFGLVSNLFPSLALAWMVARLWPPTDTSNFMRQALRRYRARWKQGSGWRLVVAWLIYLPIYYIIGKMISPIVAPYYSANLGLSLVLPELRAIIDMQVIRGAIFLLAVLPVIIVWPGSPRALWRWLGLGIFVQLAVLPMIMGYWLPSGLRVPHALELTIDSFVQAYLYTKLLLPPQGDSAELARAEPV
jgi:hypothetical protein